MSDFVQSNRHLREVLIFIFHSKNTAAETNRELHKVSVASKTVILMTTVCVKEGEHVELEALLDETNPKKRKSWGPPGHVFTSSARPNIHAVKLMLCIWWDQIGVIHYELFSPKETITGERCRLQLLRLSRALREKRPQYEQGREKVITFPNLLRSISKRSNGKSYPTRPDIHLVRSMTHGLADQQFR
ncbi:hypothetical protein Trydic_g12523 [Trypoxylus dichotomus]